MSIQQLIQVKVFFADTVGPAHLLSGADPGGGAQVPDPQK